MRSGSGIALLSALGAGRGDVVSLVGGGGKTSLALKLVAEAAAVGLRAVFTVTTQIYPPDLPVLFGVSNLLPGPGPWCVAGGPAPSGKLAGLPPGEVGRLARLADLTVVEADGSRGLPLKFPLAHEPVIPDCTTIVVPVVGASAIGQPLDTAHVHRAEAAAAFLGVPLGTPVTPEMAAILLRHPEAATRGRPASARVVPVINQADSPERLASARAVAAVLAQMGAPRVLLTAARAAQPVIAILE